jgi:hypothetical protein
MPAKPAITNKARPFGQLPPALTEINVTKIHKIIQHQQLPEPMNSHCIRSSIKIRHPCMHAWIIPMQACMQGIAAYCRQQFGAHLSWHTKAAIL